MFLLIEQNIFEANQIRKSNIENSKIKLDDFRRNGKEKNLRGHFGDLSDELFNRI